MRALSPSTLESARIARSERAGDLTSRTFGIAAGKALPQRGRVRAGCRCPRGAVAGRCGGRGVGGRSPCGLWPCNRADRRADGVSGRASRSRSARSRADRRRCWKRSRAISRPSQVRHPRLRPAPRRKIAPKRSAAADTRCRRRRLIAGPKTRDEAMTAIDEILRFYAVRSPIEPGAAWACSRSKTSSILISTPGSIKPRRAAWRMPGINLTQVDASQLSAFENYSRMMRIRGSIGDRFLRPRFRTLRTRFRGCVGGGRSFRAAVRGRSEAAAEDAADSRTGRKHTGHRCRSPRNSALCDTALDAVRTAREAMEPAGSERRELARR